MNAPHPIRQAALVLAKLDRASLDAVLERMPPEQALQIRDTLLTLSADDSSDQESAIRAFLATQSRANPSSSLAQLGDYELTDVSRAPLSPGMQKEIREDDNLSSSLRDLLAHSNRSLARTLAYERATTIAALLSSLPGDRAAGILKLLSPEARTRILAILDAGLNTNPKVVEVVAEWICDHLAESSVEPAVNLRHRSALKAILLEFSPADRQEMLSDLANENPMLAQRLAEEVSANADPPHECYC